MSRLENKVAVITGAAQSIGLACASVFLCEGAKVVLADIDSALGEASAADLQKTYPDRVLFVKTDVTKDADLEALFRRAVDTFGGVDALVCSAAIFVLKGASASREDWAKSLGVNVVSAARTVYYFGEAFSSTRGQEAKMKPRGKGGAIVLFASISAYIAQPEFVSYSATKAAILQMTRNLALDYAPHNIRVNSISPGTIFTRASRNHMAQAGMTEKQFRSEEGGKCPLNRVGEAEEMGECAAFLCSDAASYVTGSDLRADGGLVIV